MDDDTDDSTGGRVHSPSSGIELYKYEVERQDALYRGGVIPTGCHEIDDVLLKGGGFDRGSVVGISTDVLDFGLMIGLQTIARMLVAEAAPDGTPPASSDKKKAVVITVLPRDTITPIVANVLRAQLSIRFGFAVSQDKTMVRRYLDLIAISRVWDVEGLCQAIHEVCPRKIPGYNYEEEDSSLLGLSEGVRSDCSLTESPDTRQNPISPCAGKGQQGQSVAASTIAGTPRKRDLTGSYEKGENGNVLPVTPRKPARSLPTTPEAAMDLSQYEIEYDGDTIAGTPRKRVYTGSHEKQETGYAITATPRKPARSTPIAAMGPPPQYEVGDDYLPIPGIPCKRVYPGFHEKQEHGQSPNVKYGKSAPASPAASSATKAGLPPLRMSGLRKEVQRSEVLDSDDEEPFTPPRQTSSTPPENPCLTPTGTDSQLPNPNSYLNLPQPRGTPSVFESLVAAHFTDGLSPYTRTPPRLSFRQRLIRSLKASPTQFGFNRVRADIDNVNIDSDSDEKPTAPDIIFITSMTPFLASLFHTHPKEKAHLILSHLTTFFRELARDLGPLFLLLNTTTRTSAPHTNPAEPSLRSLFNNPTKHTSLDFIRPKPAYGLIFSQLLDMHILCTRLPRTLMDAEGSVFGEHCEDLEHNWAVEILVDNFALLQPPHKREQKFAAVEVRDEWLIADAFEGQGIGHFV